MSNLDSAVSAYMRAAAHKSWAKTIDRTARTSHGRNALLQKFLDMADGDPVRAASYRKAHYAKMTAASLAARAAKKAASK